MPKTSKITKLAIKPRLKALKNKVDESIKNTSGTNEKTMRMDEENLKSNKN